jgi:hypothetical protein
MGARLPISSKLIWTASHRAFCNTYEQERVCLECLPVGHLGTLLKWLRPTVVGFYRKTNLSPTDRWDTDTVPGTAGFNFVKLCVAMYFPGKVRHQSLNNSQGETSIGLLPF